MSIYVSDKNLTSILGLTDNSFFITITFLFMAEAVPPIERQQLKLEAQKSLERKGVRLLDSSERQQMSQDFLEAMQRGLQTNGKEGLLMIPTKVGPISPTGLPENKRVLVIEMGGTNKYGGIVENHAGTVEVADGGNAYVKESLREDKSSYIDANDFFNEITGEARALLGGGHIDAVGVVYSFPGTAIETQTGDVDVLSPEELPKGFKVPGISARPVGEQLLKSLQRADPNFDIDIPLVVINDTPAVALSTPGATIGGVVATGFNLAVALQNSATGKVEFYNSEAGKFTGIPTTPLSQEIDSMSANPGDGLAEKQISGKYLGQALEIAIKDLNRNGILPNLHEGSIVDAKVISDLLDQKGENIQTFFSRDLHQDDMELLQNTAGIIAERSAQAVGIMIGSMAKLTGEKHVIVPIEGSVYANVKGYQDQVARYAQEVAPDVEFRLLNVEQGGVRGAGSVALQKSADSVPQQVFPSVVRPDLTPAIFPLGVQIYHEIQYTDSTGPTKRRVLR